MDSASTGVPPARIGQQTTLLVIAIASAICIVTWLFAVRQADFERRETIRAATAQNDDRALMLQQYVSRTLAAANLATLHVAGLRARGALPLGTRDHPFLINDPIARDPGFLGLSVVDEDGNLVASTLSGAAGSSNVSAHPAFAVHKSHDSDQLFVSRPGYSRLLHGNTIWVSRRLNHADGSFAGVVAINLKPSQLVAIFGQTAVKPSESAWVVGLDGIIRARLTGGAVSSGQDVSKGEVFGKQRRIESGNFIGPGTLDRQMRLVSHLRVPGYPLFVSYSVLEDEVLRGTGRRARLFIIGATAVTIVVMLIAGLILYALRQREQRALDLTAANARLEEAQRIAHIGDWSRSARDGKITWSPQLFEMYERHPALGQPADDDVLSLLTDKSVQLTRESLARVVESGDAASWEIEVRLPSGRIRHQRVSAVPTLDRQGAIAGFHGTAQDITETRQLQELQDELAHISRVGALNTLAETLAHELNQPLTAASNYLSAGQHIAAKLQDENKNAIIDVMRQVRRQVVGASERIRRIRSLLSKGASVRSLITIDSVLDDALGLISATKACPYPVEVRGPDAELLFEGDSIQIQQVILNLVRNACEAQENRNAEPPCVEVSCDADTQILVRVVDHGPGFPEDLRDRLYEPFMSSKQSGLGLGLSISRTIVEAHGGTLTARNNPSGGASVSFTLPLHSKRPRQPHSDTTELTETSTSSMSA